MNTDTPQLPTGRLADLRADITALMDACADVPAASATDDGGTGLPLLAEAFEQLLDVMTRAENDRQTAGKTGEGDVTELGEYALQLAENLAARTARLQQDDHRRTQASLQIGLALWIARHGGIIDTLEPVVDALALYANTTQVPQTLEDLYAIIRTIAGAVSPVISQDLEKINPGRPWRVLLLNQSIVATRSHNTALMEEAFGMLTDKLPEDAGRFFTEGMQQMDALDYPRHVRELMA